jgi:two-component system response regulator RegX3
VGSNPTPGTHRIHTTFGGLVLAVRQREPKLQEFLFGEPRHRADRSPEDLPLVLWIAMPQLFRAAGGHDPTSTIDRVKTRILLVEDEATISEPLAESLGRDGFDAEVAPTLAGAREAFRRGAPDLVLLDVMLPDGDGRDLAREIRKESDVPIVLLTARGEEIDRVLGLELGADDYVVKPFSSRELTARIRAIMRRGRAREQRGPIEIGALRLDPTSRTLTKDDDPIELAAREFDLLHLLMANAGEVLRRERIMDDVWDPHWFGPTKTLDVHISWLRKKIEDDPSHPTYITTIRGVGFRFRSEAET